MANIFNSTQSHLDIVDIKDDTVILKDNSAAYVLETNAVNFDLLSPLEQDAKISSYSALLNSLTFPIQVTIRTKKMDLTDYIEKISIAESKTTSPELKNQISIYKKFIEEELVTKQNVLEKKFYVTIPYGKFGLEQRGPFYTFSKLFEEVFKFVSFGTVDLTKYNVERVLKKSKPVLGPRKDFLIKEFGRVGLRAKHLNTQELTELFYELYNSETTTNQKIQSPIGEFSAALIQSY